MEYLLIVLSVLVYGFLSLEMAQSFFPRRWEKLGPWLLVFFWGGIYLLLLLRIFPGWASLSPALNALLLLFFLLSRNRFFFRLLGVCSGAWILVALIQSFSSPEKAGFLATSGLAGLIPFFLALAKIRYEQELKTQRQLVAASERSAAQAQTIQALQGAYADQRKMIHDFRSHLGTLEHLLDQDQVAEARAYLVQLQEVHTDRILPVRSHHPVLDTLLNQKAFAAQEAGIDLQIQLNDLSGVSIREMDLVVVLGNLLDNALEACERISDPSGRWVRVKLLHSREDRQLFFSLENSSPFVEVQGDCIPTTKPDPSLHGYGLPNALEILKGYGADWVLRYSQGVFLTVVEWPEKGFSSPGAH